LGALRLSTGVEISGRLSDGGSRPDRTWDLGIKPDDAESPGSSALGSHHPIRVGPDGRFTTREFAAGRYVLSAYSCELKADGRKGSTLAMSSNVRVDTRSGPVQGLTIEMKPRSLVILRPRFADVEDYEIALRGSEGTLYLGGPLRLWSNAAVPQGSYELTLTRLQQVIAKIPFTVGMHPVVVDLP
jgi:hypothetical protein